MPPFAALRLATFQTPGDATRSPGPPRVEREALRATSLPEVKSVVMGVAAQKEAGLSMVRHRSPTGL